MSFKYIVPYQPKAKLLAWKELNINEVDILTNLFLYNGSSSDINRFFLLFSLIIFASLMIILSII
jgi:hypothetical protein